MNNTQKPEHDEYYYNKVLDITLKSLEEMNNYNSIVCSIGFVSILAVLSYTHSSMDKIFLFFTCFCYLLSVAIFIVFEIKKVFLNNSYHQKISKNLKEYINEEIPKEKLFEKNLRAWDDIYSDFAKKQNLYFMPSAFLGTASGIIIVLNFINKGLNFYIQQICICH